MGTQRYESRRKSSNGTLEEELSVEKQLKILNPMSKLPPLNWESIPTIHTLFGVRTLDNEKHKINKILIEGKAHVNYLLAV